MSPPGSALIVYSVQLLAVVTAATLAAHLLREAAPAARLTYWRLVSALCLALPFLAGNPAGNALPLSVAFGSDAAAAGRIVPSASTTISLEAAILWAWATGALLRISWLATGAWRLHRLRRTSTVARLDDEIQALRQTLAPRAEIRWSDAVEQPVTFGLRRPIVLLPRRFGALSGPARRAVACHELQHVARRDWMWIVVEEHARAVFWFHPAVWWLVEQLQLAREQVVDRLVVATTVSRRTYMSALLEFADRRGAMLSIAFTRRRHLRSRFHQLLTEKQMSSTRTLFTSTLLAIVIGGAAFGIVRALPLDLPPLGLQSRAAGLEIRLAETAPAAGLRETVVAGSGQRVYLHQATLATQADVTSARVVDIGNQFGVDVRFSGPAATRMLDATAAHLGRPVAIMLDQRLLSLVTLKAPIRNTAVISGYLTESGARDLAAKLAPAASAQDGATRDRVTLPVPIHQERAAYTPEAMAAKIEGTVLLESVVLSDGSVGDITVIRSLDKEFGLDQQAIDALKRWTWKPGMKDGKPAPVTVTIEITFTLK